MAHPRPPPLAAEGREGADEARRRHDIAGAPDADRPLSPCVINTVSQRPEAIAAAPASKMLCRRRGKGVGGRRAGNNLPLGRVGLIHLLLLEKNRPDSRNGCGSREMRLD